MGRVLFVTGTDTGVGKTALTALMLAHAQGARINVRALKPFSTGDGGDEDLLEALQKGPEQSRDFPGQRLINFFHFAEPISPWSAARIHGRKILPEDVLERIREHQRECDLLLVEGAGGLLTPLGEGFGAAELIVELKAEAVVVAANRLGALNHTLLTVEALRRRGVERLKVALVEQAGADASRKTNLDNLKELLAPVPVISIPFLPNYRPEAAFIRAAARGLKSELDRLAGAA